MATSLLANQNFQGNADAEDTLLFNWLIRLENDWRTAQNVTITAANNATDPPGTTPLLPILSNSTGALRKSGAEAYLTRQFNSTVGGYRSAAADDQARIDLRFRDLKTALNTKLDAGKTMDQLLAAINAA